MVITIILLLFIKFFFFFKKLIPERKGKGIKLWLSDAEVDIQPLSHSGRAHYHHFIWGNWGIEKVTCSKSHSWEVKYFAQVKVDMTRFVALWESHTLPRKKTIIRIGTLVLASAAPILKLKRYRGDEHGPCARMTRKFRKRSILKKQE